MSNRFFAGDLRLDERIEWRFRLERQGFDPTRTGPDSGDGLDGDEWGWAA